MKLLNRLLRILLPDKLNIRMKLPVHLAQSDILRLDHLHKSMGLFFHKRVHALLGRFRAQVADGDSVAMNGC